ncbi:MAG: acetolactate synthase small subunit [Gammaproteobacteria bacterium]|nr:MAG: acetolactate synthase small subunit [Gammaproteobacteria bacterium]
MSDNGKDPAGDGTQIFVVYVEDKPGVLNRVASLFRRRAFNIDSLAVGPTHQPGVSRMTIAMQADEVVARRVEANLYKLVNVLRVENVTHVPLVTRDLALIKVKANAAERAQVLQMCDVFRARAVDVGPEALIVEITGTEEKIESLCELLRPFGILELVRTGQIAMTRGSEVPSINPEFVAAEVPNGVSNQT